MTEEEIKNLKFMSIGSNCYGIAYMEKQRVRGPIDNVLALKGLSSSISLFERTLENEILNTTPKVYVEAFAELKIRQILALSRL